jgi:hypothetical protein
MLIFICQYIGKLASDLAWTRLDRDHSRLQPPSSIISAFISKLSYWMPCLRVGLNIYIPQRSKRKENEVV